jgi:hypothetical protein
MTVCAASPTFPALTRSTIWADTAEHPDLAALGVRSCPVMDPQPNENASIPPKPLSGKIRATATFMDVSASAVRLTLDSCGLPQPAVTQPNRALASEVNPATGSSPGDVSSWTATWSAPASRCLVRPAATVSASP